MPLQNSLWNPCPDNQIVAALRRQLGWAHFKSLIPVKDPLKRDLKLGMFAPADVGQMEFYLRWLKKHEMLPGESEPLGLILCAEKCLNWPATKSRTWCHKL
jgi:hypothetical protein